ncbi:PepSY-associated TM helix domain-containing protein [Acidovorax sp. SUPP3434]|uniref:PepSY-associated TM helix domain-containing protein n=1 Tax=Acidovorax sp. SUPP3434 TaxID=2920880 RepID=UPI0023DE6325|nr:PepSY-associated TM helix domain-containing protein [Acidovorax sp. SUPP3434]GKT00178.1 PepSY-associated TM helix domain-containing protein [Acidovorax sp. SUPP3434]
MTRPPDPRRRARWLKTLHEWHWVSSAICLVGMLLFAVTGFTLNHAGQIEAKPRVTSLRATVPAPVLQAMAPPVGQARAPWPPALQDWARAQWSVDTAGREAEWSADEVYVSLPRPGGDAWIRVGLADGEAEYERTDRGWISYFNDLHKGRNTGAAWSWFIDAFAAACLVFCITGLFILKMHAGNRPFTWPMVGLGLVLPALLAFLFIH